MRDIALGFLVGILSSGFFWWITTRLLRPRIAFGDGIRKTENDALEAGYSYASRILNVGFRDAVDVEITVALRYVDPAGRSDFAQLVALSPLTTRVMVLRRRRVKEFLGKRRYGGNRGFGIKAQDTEGLLKRAQMPESILRGVRDKTLRLDQVLEALPGSSVEVAVSAWDNFSGSRRIFMSPRWSLGDIREGEWVGRRIVATASSKAGEKVEPLSSDEGSRSASPPVDAR